MNVKAEKLYRTLKDNAAVGVTAVKEIDNKLHTTLFFVNLPAAPGTSELWRLLVLTDDTQNILLQVDFKADKDALPRGNVLQEKINRLNQQYPLCKFYYDRSRNTVFLELIYVAHDDCFEPALLAAQIKWLQDNVLTVRASLTAVK